MSQDQIIGARRQRTLLLLFLSTSFVSCVSDFLSTTNDVGLLFILLIPGRTSGGSEQGQITVGKGPQLETL